MGAHAHQWRPHYLQRLGALSYLHFGKADWEGGNDEGGDTNLSLSQQYPSHSFSSSHLLILCTFALWMLNLKQAATKFRKFTYLSFAG